MGCLAAALATWLPLYKLPGEKPLDPDHHVWDRRAMSDVPKLKSNIVFTRAGMVRGGQRLLPVSVFVLPFGIAFGAAAIEAGLTPDQAIIMSMVMFAGASQFAALDLWASPLPYLSLMLVVLAVNARHFILGAALAPYVNPLPTQHWFAALITLSDVNFAQSYQAMKDGEQDAAHVLGGGVVLWSIWAMSTTLGVFAGSALGDLERFGVDVVMASFFAALSVGMVPNLRRAIPVLVACVVAVLTLDLFPAGWNIIAAALAGGVVGVLDPQSAQPEKRTAR